jgi:hypothetical protein
MRGRPTKLTPAVADEIVAVLAAGGSIRDAAASTGVAARTIWAWRSRAYSRDPHDRRCVALERHIRDVYAHELAQLQPNFDPFAIEFEPAPDDWEPIAVDGP